MLSVLYLTMRCAVQVQFRYVLMGFIGLKLDASYGWGGAMMLSKHRFDREKDPLKIRQIWTDGSVQDDMVLSSIAIENGLFVANVPHAVFFNELRQGISYATSFDFLRRQIFVAACYHSWTTRARHIAMLYVSCCWVVLHLNVQCTGSCV